MTKLETLQYEVTTGKIPVNEAIQQAYILRQQEIEILMLQLLALTDEPIFVEYYSHEKADCYKINNIYTNSRTDIHVLCTVEDGFTLAVNRAIEQIAKCKIDFFNAENI